MTDHFNKRLTILVPDSSAHVPKPNVQLLVDIMGLLWPFGIPRMPLLIWLPPWPLPLLLQGIHRLSGDCVLSNSEIHIVSKKNKKPVSSGQEASAGPASALAQWHGGLRDAGAALQISSPQPFHITSMGLISFNQKALRIPLVITGGKLLVPFQEAFEIGLANLCLIQSPSSGFVIPAVFGRQATSDNAS